jgi:adenine-specific DNA-methyltransferase
MDYIGSKLKLNDWIFGILFRKGYIDFETRSQYTFVDACSGTASVSRFAAREGFNIIANDLMMYAKCIASGSIQMNIYLFEEALHHISFMNKLPGIEGFFYKEYSESAGRLYFSNDNAKLIDASRQYIETIDNIIVKDYLIYCLLEAVSRISNTTGVYGAFLKTFKSRALEKLTLKQEAFFTAQSAKIYNLDIMNLIKLLLPNKNYILYIDPPYNERQYGSNYHIYETIARYDNPVVHGITGLRNWIVESKSKFCTRKDCLNFTKEIIANANAKLILLSYNSDGLLTKEDILSIGTELNIRCDFNDKNYRRYKADDARQNRQDDLYEYLFIFIKSEV